MARCEHRYLADVYSDADTVTNEKGEHARRAGAKPEHKECLDCGAIL